MTNSDKELQCPTCSTEVLWNSDFPFRPFCSKRCQLIDLGEWADESHRIPGSSVYDQSPDVDSETDF